MAPRLRSLLAWLPMVGAVALAMKAVAAWDRLPVVMASHFGADGIANGWMPRTQFFIVSFASLVPAIALLAVIAARVGRRKPMAGVGLLALEWLVSGLLISVFWSAIDANLYHQRLAVFPVWIILAALVPVTFAVAIDWRWWLSRGRIGGVKQVAAPEQLVAEETHGSIKSAVGLLLLGVGLVALVMVSMPHRPPLAVLALPAVVMVVIALAALWAWRGFVYRFTTAAVEVRVFGVRVRRIPLSEIEEFDAEEVHPLTDFGGWGIKGFGSDTAYIWGGNTALHIKTYTGDVYLGHRDPERLVHHLDAVMKPEPKSQV